ncbi:MAG TPA: SRPBCC family protein [Nitrososphaerales archaeon]|nr:SRPBCC family protein [Nitrososphaerales archaeon]
MPKYECTRIIRAPRAYVYYTFANMEDLPKISNTFRAAKPLGKEGDANVFEVEMESGGRKLKGKLKRRCFQNERIEEEVNTDISFSKNTYIFSDVPEGTKLTFAIDMTLKGATGRLLGGLAKGSVKKMVDGDMEKGKSYLEANKPS